MRRIIERDIPKNIVLEVLREGEIVREYPEDKPYPSALFRKRFKDTEIYVVASLNEIDEKLYIITVYKKENQK